MQDSCKVFCEKETKLNMIFSLACTRAAVGQILWTCEEISACVPLWIIFFNCTVCLKPYICNIEAIYSHVVQNNAHKTSFSTSKCTLAYRIIMHVGTHLLLCYFQNYIICLLDYVLFKWNGWNHTISSIAHADILLFSNFLYTEIMKNGDMKLRCLLSPSSPQMLMLTHRTSLAEKAYLVQVILSCFLITVTAQK